MNYWLQAKDGIIIACFEHGKQAASQSLPAEKVFSLPVLSVIEVNCTYAA